MADGTHSEVTSTSLGAQHKRRRWLPLGVLMVMALAVTVYLREEQRASSHTDVTILGFSEKYGQAAQTVDVGITQQKQAAQGQAASGTSWARRLLTINHSKCDSSNAKLLMRRLLMLANRQRHLAGFGQVQQQHP